MIDTGQPKRICLIKPSALGDIVQSLPVLSVLRDRFPHAHIAWVVNQNYTSLLQGHPYLDEIIPLDRAAWNKGWGAGITSSWQTWKLLRQRRFDLTIDLQGLLRSGLMTLATRARIRIGLASAREGARWSYTHRVHDVRETEHAVDRYWRVAEALNLGQQSKRFVLPMQPDAETWAERFTEKQPRPLIAVSVGARWVTKRWPPGHFHVLLRRAARFGGSIVFVGAADEAELADRAAHGLPFIVHNLAGQTTLPQLTSLLRRADIMLSNDTGPLHLATAVGVPSVAPYTCTQVRRNGPYGQEGHAVETTVPCAGSYLKQCDRLDCMRDLTPDRLWPVLSEILCRWQANRLSA